MPTGKRLESQDDLAGGATLANVITAFNALLQELRDAGWMDR